MDRLRLGKHRGVVCVIASHNAFDTPEADEHYYPTRYPASDFDDRDLAESKVYPGSGYGYSFKVPGISFWLECHVNGNDRAIRVDIVPIPCPKVRKGIETRYRNGDWEKRLKTGWEKLYAQPDYTQAKQLELKPA